MTSVNETNAITEYKKRLVERLDRLDKLNDELIKKFKDLINSTN